MRFMLILGHDAVELTLTQLEHLEIARLIERSNISSPYHDEVMFIPKPGIDPRQVELMCFGGNA